MTLCQRHTFSILLQPQQMTWGNWGNVVLYNWGKIDLLSLSIRINQTFSRCVQSRKPNPILFMVQDPREVEFGVCLRCELYSGVSLSLPLSQAFPLFWRPFFVLLRQFSPSLQESQVDPMWLCLIRWLTIKPPSNSLKGWHQSKSSTEWFESNGLDFKAGVLTLRWILPLSYCRYVLSLLGLLLPYIVLVTLGSV